MVCAHVDFALPLLLSLFAWWLDANFNFEFFCWLQEMIHWGQIIMAFPLVVNMLMNLCIFWHISSTVYIARMYTFFTSFVSISNTRWWKVIWHLFWILGSSVKYHIPISLVSPFFRRSPSSCRPRYTSSPGRWGASSSSSSSSCLLWPPLSTGEIEFWTRY